MTELTNLRTYTQKVYQQGNGKVYDIHSGHIHYKDGGGSLQDIDLSLRRDDANSRWVMTTASYEAAIPYFADGVVRFRNKYKQNDHVILSAANVAHVQGVLRTFDGIPYVFYPEAFGVKQHLRIRLSWRGIRHEVVVMNKPPVGTTLNFNFALTIPGGFNFNDGNNDWDGQSDFDYTGKNLALRLGNQASYFLRPKVWDSNGLEANVPVKIGTSGGVIFLRKTLGDAILQNDRVTYPIVTDHPTDFTSIGVDGTIIEAITVVGVPNQQATWDQAHDATDGTSTNTAGTTFRCQSLLSVINAVPPETSEVSVDIRRAAITFDTSTITDTDIVTSAALFLKPTSKTDTDNDGNDFVAVVKSFQASSTALANADFDQIGDAINNPTELCDRIDIGDIVTGSFNSFNFKISQLSAINKTGYTMLGIREGHDVVDDKVADDLLATNCIFNSSEATGTASDPFLRVITATSAVFIQGANILGANIL